MQGLQTPVQSEIAQGSHVPPPYRARDISHPLLAYKQGHAPHRQSLIPNLGTARTVPSERQ